MNCPTCGGKIITLSQYGWTGCVYSYIQHILDMKDELCNEQQGWAQFQPEQGLLANTPDDDHNNAFFVFLDRKMKGHEGAYSIADMLEAFQAGMNSEQYSQPYDDVPEVRG